MTNEVAAGSPFPLGATVVPGGVNFSVYSKNAEKIELLLFDNADAGRPARVITLDPQRHRTYHYWHVFVPDVSRARFMAIGCMGRLIPLSGCASIRQKLLLDPYGRGVVVPRSYDRAAASRPGDNVGHGDEECGRRPERATIGKATLPLRRPSASTIIYEMHVARLHAASQLRRAGRQARHLRRADRENSLSAASLASPPSSCCPSSSSTPRMPRRAASNYWGYQPDLVLRAASGIQFAARTRWAAVDEFRDMVKALHRAGIEVILDVVFNHTAEGSQEGPTISFRGLENATYYILEPDRARTATTRAPATRSTPIIPSSAG